MTLTVQGKFKTDLDKAVRIFHKIFLNNFLFFCQKLNISQKFALLTEELLSLCECSGLRSHNY